MRLTIKIGTKFRELKDFQLGDMAEREKCFWQRKTRM
jgi:hypothetical protein